MTSVTAEVSKFKVAVKFCPFAKDGRCREGDCSLWIEFGGRSMCAWKAIGLNALVEATSIRS